jgi:periplasmic divalent cation tolerance protein
MTEALIVFTAFAKEEDAARVVRVLVEERLIACGNLMPGARSLYRWKGEVADERETIVLMKTRKQDWAALMSRLSELHPYDTPECVAVRIAAGAPKYMAWLEAVLAGEDT